MYPGPVRHQAPKGWFCLPALVIPAPSVPDVPAFLWLDRGGRQLHWRALREAGGSEPSGVEDRAGVAFDHFRDGYHLEDSEIELVEIIAQRSVEREFFGVRDFLFAVLVPVLDQRLLEFVGFRQELLQLQTESFGRREIVVRAPRCLCFDSVWKRRYSLYITP
jgi:hypothetical protein